MDKIKAIIFDWGGVLIDDPAPVMAEYICKVLEISIDEAINAHKKYIDEFQKGEISETEFWIKVCSDLKINLPTSDSLWGEAFRHAYSPKKEMFDLAEALKRTGYKTAFLSNTEEPAMKYFYEIGYNMFDVSVFSCAVNAIKPEKKIYDLTLENLGVNPFETIFIDDRPDYISGAQNAGLKTILFKNPQDVIEKLALYSVTINL